MCPLTMQLISEMLAKMARASTPDCESIINYIIRNTCVKTTIWTLKKEEKSNHSPTAYLLAFNLTCTVLLSVSFAVCLSVFLFFIVYMFEVNK